MIGRRGILGLLAAAPVAAPQVVTEMATGAALGASVADKVSHVDDRARIAETLYRDLLDGAHSKPDYGAPLPPHIEGKVSWSRAFKVSEAHKEEMRHRSLVREIERAMWESDGLDKISALRKIAARLGVSGGGE